MGAVGSGLLNFSGDPKFRTLTNVKNKGVESRLVDMLGDYDTIKQTGNDALSQYIAKYLADTNAAERRTGEEAGVLDRLYSGGVAADLATLRNQRKAAVGDAATLGANMAFSRANRSVVGGDSPGGSYHDRLLAAATMPYTTQAAVDDAAQARTDYDSVLGQQIALGGRRQSMFDTLMARGLAPQQARQAMYSTNLQDLGGISALENANNLYGVQQKTTGQQRWGRFLGDLQGMQDKDLATAAQSY